MNKSWFCLTREENLTVMEPCLPICAEIPTGFAAEYQVILREVLDPKS